MQIYENRVTNGLLKTNLEGLTPEILSERLAMNVSIVVDPPRLSSADLWPCVWALSKAIEKQFTGKIFICGKAEGELSAPSPISERVSIVNEFVETPIIIGVGVQPLTYPNSRCIFGDVNGSSISYGCLLDSSLKAHPVSGFALAGYLGFAALAIAAGLPEFRADLTQGRINLPFQADQSQLFIDGLTFVGLGQLGQAYLSLLFFLNVFPEQQIILLDKGRFEEPNYNTQILLDEKHEWNECWKATYLEDKFTQKGWNVKGEIASLDWGWSRPTHHNQKVIVGLDKFETRRVVMNAGYEWMFEAGLGTSFLEPRLSWHSIPASSGFEYLFVNKTDSGMPDVSLTEYEKELRDSTPGGCGLVTYQSISASAPSMGLVASAFVWSEILNHQNDKKYPTKGNAFVWSSILPFLRENMSLAQMANS